MASKKHSTPSGLPQKHLEKNTYKKKSPLITGTLLLASAGFITRIIGFFNRIYLSQLIGPKEMGIYQLIFPVYMISFAFCCHGMELALSQLIASSCAKSSSSRKNFSDTEKNPCSPVSWQKNKA
jgi:drug/metabolite transporter (DMT)-like permease